MGINGLKYIPGVEKFSGLRKSDIRYLNIIHKHKPKSIYELSKIAQRSSGAVHGALKTLENKGFITIEKTTNKFGRNYSTPKIIYENCVLTINLISSGENNEGK